MPNGAVGTDRCGTAAIKALSRYSSRLSGRQRAVLTRLLRPHPQLTIDPSEPGAGRAALAAAPTGLGDLPAIIAEALRRLKAHGIVFRYGISLDMLATNKSTEDAHTVASWLERTGSVCAIFFRPSGLHENLFIRRQLMLHELMHCAAAEQSSSKAAWDNQPSYLDEGLPEWASYIVAVEWQGRPGDSSFWLDYLDQPYLDARTRSYDAVGLWSLFEHEGVDLFGLQPALVHAGGSGDPSAPLNLALASAPATAVADWGSTLATAASQGARWNLDGPGMPLRHEPEKTVDDGGS